MVDSSLFLQESEAMLTRLYAMAYHILSSKADAEDAVQQGLMKAWAAKNSVQKDKFKGWLARIIVNECRNIQRYRMRIVPSETVQQKQSTFAPPDIDLMDAIQQLPDAIRIPFILKYQACLTEEEVAFSMRLPKSTIKNRLSKARKMLRNSLTEWEVSFE